MNTAALYIKTEPTIKSKAQKVARELGFSLSYLVNVWLKQFVKTKRVTFRPEEEPSKYLIGLMKKAKEDWKKGKGSPIFDSGEEAVKWLKEQGI